MPIQNVNVAFSLNWVRPNGISGPYCFGDRKDIRFDRNWDKKNVIYRWIKASTGEVAMVGETDRSLTRRADNYCSAKPGSFAGETNRKLYAEQAQLSLIGDHLYLEFVDQVPGYNLTDKRDRRFAEHYSLVS